MPAIEEDYDIPDEKKFCEECGLPYKLFPTTDDSEVIEIEVKAHKRIIKRKKYRRTCSCNSQLGIITAPAQKN